MGVTLSFVSVICDHVDDLAAFYRSVFDLEPVDALASEHFRALRIGGTVLGFSARSAYEMLNLVDPGVEQPPTTFWTFEVDTDQQVDDLTGAAVSAGGRLVKPPYGTYYGAWQSVLLDPAGHAFRINHSSA